ncbi:hypothetical protein, partial [Pseudomonas guariconensis]
LLNRVAFFAGEPASAVLVLWGWVYPYGPTTRAMACTTALARFLPDQSPRAGTLLATKKNNR